MTAVSQATLKRRDMRDKLCCLPQFCGSAGWATLTRASQVTSISPEIPLCLSHIATGAKSPKAEGLGVRTAHARDQQGALRWAAMDVPPCGLSEGLGLLTARRPGPEREPPKTACPRRPSREFLGFLGPSLVSPRTSPPPHMSLIHPRLKGKRLGSLPDVRREGGKGGWALMKDPRACPPHRHLEPRARAPHDNVLHTLGSHPRSVRSPPASLRCCQGTTLLTHPEAVSYFERLTAEEWYSHLTTCGKN